MDPNPQLPETILVATQLELVSGTTASGTLYGFSFCLYCLYLHASLPQLRDNERRRQAQVMITCSTSIMICGLYYLVSNAWVIQDAYIKHGNFPGGPLVYENFTYTTQPAVAVGLVSQSIIELLTAAIQIWRLWVVWSGTRYAKLIIVLPLLCFLGFIALRIRTIVIDVTLVAGEDLLSQITRAQTANLALQATITTRILPTILIAGYLIFESQRQRKLIGQSGLLTPYMSVVAILAESYAMESIWTFFFVIFLSLGHPVAQFFGDTQVYIEIIAYLLVLYRVANRRAFGSQIVRGLQSRHCDISTLHWNHTGTTQSDFISRGAGIEIQPSGNHKPETSILQGQGSLV